MGLFNDILTNFTQSKYKTTTQDLNQDKNLIRLFYMSLTKYPGYSKNRTMINTTYTYTNPYQLPNGMSMEEACQVVSFLADKVSTKNHYPIENMHNSTFTGYELEKYGFTKLQSPLADYYNADGIYIPQDRHYNLQIEGVTDLITFIGDEEDFSRTDISKHYFDWYTPGITKEQIDSIYDKLGITLGNSSNELTNI